MPSFLPSEGPEPTAPDGHDDAVAPGGAAIVLLDDDARIRRAGASAAAMLGYSPPSLVGRSLADLAAQGWHEAAEVATARIRFGATDRFQLMLCGRSGRLSLIEMTPQPDDGAPQGNTPSCRLAWANRWLRMDAAQAHAEEEVRRLASELMQLREVEHLNVARLLQVDLANNLILTKFLIEAAAHDRPPEQTDRPVPLLTQAASGLREVIAGLQEISFALRPPLLDDLGLLPTLEWCCRDFERAHPQIAVVRQLTAAESSIPEPLKLQILRIVQDALNNVACHAQASTVRVTLSARAGELRLTVEDNGHGFDAAAAIRCGRTRIGLPSIRRRIQATGGQMVLDSVVRRGTQLAAVWPIQAAQLIEK